MKCVSVHLNSKTTIEKLSKDLILLGCEILYTEEDSENKIIYAKVKDDFDMSLYHPGIKEIFFYQLPEINWVEQYENHGLNYFDGFVHADLKEFGCINPLYNPIKIEPGSGFGDLSHATTTLTLKLMNGHLLKKNVLDIGSGSGILSFGAVSMGAKNVFGIDVDEGAICHSKSNISLNNMENLVHFGLPSEYKLKQNEELIILMNMIHQEQVEAWKSLKIIHQTTGSCFTSGILKTGKKDYLKWTTSLGWKLISTLEDCGWLAFHFTR